MLADRFKLTFHREKKELSVYAITVAKGGEKIRKEENSTLPIPGFGGRPQGGFNVRNGTIAEFASVMQGQFMEQPVVDQTGLGEPRNSFVLKWTPDPSQRSGFGGGPPPDVASPGTLTRRQTSSPRCNSSWGSKWEVSKRPLM